MNSIATASAMPIAPMMTTAARQLVNAASRTMSGGATRNPKLPASVCAASARPSRPAAMRALRIE